MALERTLILVKPDAMQRRLAGRLISRIEERGLKLVGMKLLQITPELAAQHYSEHVEKPFYPRLEQFISSGPVIAIVAEGPEAIEVVRNMMGPTNGRKAAAGTIRGDYGLSQQKNLMHGSDGPEAAAKEIAIYFKDEGLLDYSTVLDQWSFTDEEK
jgi:nucleoside-diphosphate kinase